MIELIALWIIERLPPGSGIDCDWEYKITSKSIHFMNSFHCMDEFGGYDGYQDFKIRFPIDADDWTQDFVFTFRNGKGKHAWHLEEYLLDMFSTVFFDMEQEFCEAL